MRYSYGIIPVFLAAEGPEYLLINQIDGRKGTDYWTFPKGTPEEGESPLETARRETEEEVGIAFETIDTSASFDSHYTFDLDGQPVEKTATFFAGMVASKAFRLQETEVSDAVWLSYVAARERLTYERGRELLDRVHEHVMARLSAEK